MERREYAPQSLTALMVNNDLAANETKARA